MLPLQQLLHRVKWDRDFGRGEFALGYYDRVLKEEVVVPLASVAPDPERADTFLVTDPDGVVRHIPYHRVRAVYKNGEAIWRRPT
jgi:uncharacterized protein (UPF0248 family)